MINNENKFHYRKPAEFGPDIPTEIFFFFPRLKLILKKMIYLADFQEVAWHYQVEIISLTSLLGRST